MAATMLQSGTRVRLLAPDPTLTLRNDLGTIVGPDQYLEYYVVRLDQPALLRHGDGDTEEVVEIVEDLDNLEVIQSGVGKDMSGWKSSPASKELHPLD